MSATHDSQDGIIEDHRRVNCNCAPSPPVMQYYRGGRGGGGVWEPLKEVREIPGAECRATHKA